jgi:predicted Zn-dependent protease
LTSSYDAGEGAVPNFTTTTALLKAAVAALALVAAATQAQDTLPCPRDPDRHAQLAEQDTTQLYELQAQYGHHVVSDRTRAVFARLVHALGHHDARGRPVDWRLRGYGAASANAHALHTGTMLITRGLDTATMSDDALAASLAHELAHVLLRHGIEQACFSLQVINPTLALSQVQTDVASESWSSHSAVGQRLRELSQRHELQADAWAVQLLARAGFAPDAMSQLLAHLAAKPVGGFSTGSHPSLALRLHQARQAETLAQPTPLLKTAAATPTP